MISVVIIDDDIEMLIGLKQIINWEQYGYKVIGEADNGEKGLEIIEKYKPAVVITDITMPGVNGLDMIEKAQKIVPNLKSIILTCHENFLYAKQAIKLSACDYVLKYTLTKDILIEMITKLREKIQDEESMNSKILRIGEELKYNKDVLKQKVFKDLVNDSNKNKDVLKIYDGANALNIKLPDKSYILAGIYIDNYEIGMEKAKLNEQLLVSSMENAFYEIFMDYDNCSYFDYSMETKYILIWDESDNNLPGIILNSKLNQYQKYINTKFNLKISICISKVYQDILKVKEAFKECEELRDEYFYSGGFNVVKTKREKWITYKNLYSKYKDQWLEVLLTDSNEKMINFTKNLSSEVKKANYTPSIVRGLFNSLIIDIKSIANKNGVEINCKTGFDTMDSCVESLEASVNALSKGLQTVLSKNFRNEMKKVLQYIDENLSEHITCDKMSEYIKMNTNYFSRLFKKEIGISFSDYVIKQKVDKATYFLKYSGHSVEEIAFLTGFSNVSYFYKTYKKITGKTPGEVRG